jgi:hypothetical protein
MDVYHTLLDEASGVPEGNSQHWWFPIVALCNTSFKMTYSCQLFLSLKFDHVLGVGNMIFILVWDSIWI